MKSKFTAAISKVHFGVANQHQSIHVRNRLQGFEGPLVFEKKKHEKTAKGYRHTKDSV